MKYRLEGCCEQVVDGTPTTPLAGRGAVDHIFVEGAKTGRANLQRKPAQMFMTPHNQVRQTTKSNFSRQFVSGLVALPSQSAAPTGIGEFLIGAGLLVGTILAITELLSPEQSVQRTCGVCGRAGHDDRRSCPHDGPRLGFSSSIPKASRCECCGTARYGTQRHHTRGRASLADFLDVCLDCHIDCCHDGHFQNLGKKPRACRHTGNISAWRDRRSLKLVNANHRGS